MKAWIVTGFEELTERIRNSVSRSSINSSSVQEFSLPPDWQSVTLPMAEGDVVFYAVPFMSNADMDILRRIRSSTRALTVVVSSVADNTTVLKALRAGAADFLNADGDISKEIEDCISRISLDLVLQPTKTQVISIMACHISGDANVLAANIAAVAAKQLGNCALLDFQLRGGDLALLLKLAPRHTLYDLINQGQSIDDAMFRQALTPHDSGIHLLAGPELFSDLRGIDPHHCEEILLRAKAAFPFVVIVTEDIQHSEQIYALTNSHHIVVAMRPDLVSLYRAKRHIDFLTEHLNENHHLHVVAMGTGLPGELELPAVKRVLQLPTIYSIPDDAAAITASINVGSPIVLESPRSKVSRAIYNFTAELAGWDESSTGAGNEGPLSAAKAAAVLAVNTLPFLK